MSNIQNILPDKVHIALYLAIKNLKYYRTGTRKVTIKSFDNKKIECQVIPQMNDWYAFYLYDFYNNGLGDNTCTVCLAGSILLRNRKIRDRLIIHSNLAPLVYYGIISENDYSMLRVIDSIRRLEEGMTTRIISNIMSLGSINHMSAINLKKTEFITNEFCKLKHKKYKNVYHTSENTKINDKFFDMLEEVRQIFVELDI